MVIIVSYMQAAYAFNILWRQLIIQWNEYIENPLGSFLE